MKLETDSLLYINSILKAWHGLLCENSLPDADLVVREAGTAPHGISVTYIYIRDIDLVVVRKNASTQLEHGLDPTGSLYTNYTPRYAAINHVNARTCLKTRCGLKMDLVVIAHEKQTPVRVQRLPCLGAEDEPCLLTVTAFPVGEHFVPSTQADYLINDCEWIDLGFGIPLSEPLSVVPGN